MDNEREIKMVEGTATVEEFQEMIQTAREIVFQGPKQIEQLPASPDFKLKIACGLILKAIQVACQ